MNDKQRVFVEEYLRCWNATRAASKAGYEHPNKQGPRLLVNVGIRAEIERRLTEKIMAANEVLARLSDMASMSLEDFLTFDDGDSPVIDLEKARRRGKLHLVKRIKEGKYGLEIELHDQQAALVHLGKHYRLFVDRVELADWRDEAERAGVNPGDLLEQLIQQIAASLDAGETAASE